MYKMKNKKTAYAMSYQDFDIMCATNHSDEIYNNKECYHTINDLKESIYGPKQNI